MQENTNLHVHSNYSDGAFSPKQLLELANASRLKHLSITDHNSIDAYWEILSAPKGNTGITIGTELTCKHFNRSLGKKITLHICAYFPSKPEETLRDTFEIIEPIKRVCKSAAMGINERRKIQVKKLQKAGLNVTIQEVENEATARSANKNSFVMLDVNDIARVLSRKSKLCFEEVRQMLKHSPDFYVSAAEDWNCFWVGTIAKKISRIGGIACLAHPTRRIPLEALDETLAELSDFGISAIEAFNKTTKAEEERIIELAKKFNLLITTGNDFHGIETPINPTLEKELLSIQLARSKLH